MRLANVLIELQTYSLNSAESITFVWYRYETNVDSICSHHEHQRVVPSFGELTNHGIAHPAFGIRPTFAVQHSQKTPRNPLRSVGHRPVERAAGPSEKRETHGIECAQSAVQKWYLGTDAGFGYVECK